LTHRRAIGSLCAAVLAAALALTGCSAEDQGGNVDPDQVDATAAPDLGACRMLTPDDVNQPANATKTVDCAEKHTAQTFLVDELPDELDDVDYDDPKIGKYAYEACSKEYAEFLGADESLVLRTILSWAWFRPSESAWDHGARWFRCDVVGGTLTSDSYRPLPESAKGLLLGRPDDRWMVCAKGDEFETSAKVPCAQPHDWRAVTSVKVGQPDDEYPGDEVVAGRTDNFCRTSVLYWLNYPATFDFAYTYFHQAEWDSGNRLSVCWAKTDE
jgi:hypothetical protein